MTQKHIDYIDGLRALGVLAVIVFHFCPALLPGGFSGVDVFFVISGFVVSSALSQRANQSTTEYALGFYSRRVVRIVPALALCLIATSLLSAMLIPKAWLSDFNEQTARFAFLGFSNQILASADGYFAPRSEFNPFTHTWSLGIEEQFYFIFPILFYFANAARFSKKTHDRVSLSVLFLCAASFVYCALIRFDPNFAFYSAMGRFWELGIGVCLFIVTRSALRNSKRAIVSGSLPIIAQSVALGSILIGFFYADPNCFPYPWAILPVVGTSLLIFSLATQADSGKPNMVRRLLTLPIVKFVGRISYSLYLWHWPVFVLLRWTFGLPPQPSMVVTVAAMILTAILGLFSYYFVELSAQRWIEVRKFSSLQKLFGGLICAAVGFAATTVIFQNQPSLSFSVTSNRADWYADYKRAPEACEPQKTETSIPPFSKEEIKPGCRKSIVHRLFVVGDSHASAYEPLFKMLSEKERMDVTVYARGGCEIFNVVNPLEPVSEDCATFYKAALEDVAAVAKPGDSLFLPGLRLKRRSDQWSSTVANESNALFSKEEVEAIAQKKLSDYHLRPILDKGIRVVIEAPKPVLPSPAFRCSDWFNRMNPVCAGGLSISTEAMNEQRKEILTTFARFEREEPLIEVWDPTSKLCGAEICAASENGRPLFFDTDHLSRYANVVLFEDFKRRVVR